MAEGIWFREKSMDKIFIKDLLTRGIIGITDLERSQPQDILINVEINTDITKAGVTDNIQDCVNYKTVSKIIFTYIEQHQHHTVEALATNLVQLVLAEPNAISVRLRVEKPGAVRFSRSVGVEIERKKT
jgi:FolB domain-containing protein